MMRAAVLSLLQIGAVVLGTAGAATAQEYVFHYQPAQVGDESSQLVNLNLNLDVQIKKDGVLVDSSQRKLQRKQQRTMEVLEAGAKGPTRVKVTYQQAEKGLGANAQPVESVAQAVAGRSYLVARVGEELTVTDVAGQPPAAEELAIVTHDMAALGLPNPIGAYFHNRRMQIGEKVELPNDLAKDLLGFTDTVGEVTRFSMKLAAIRQVGGATCAVLETEFAARSKQAGTMSMQIRGQLLLELDTCTAVVVQLTGPVSMLEARGLGQGQYELNTHGTLTLAAQSSRTQRR